MNYILYPNTSMTLFMARGGWKMFFGAALMAKLPVFKHSLSHKSLWNKDAPLALWWNGTEEIVQGFACSYTLQPQFDYKASWRSSMYTGYNLSLIQKRWCNNAEEDSEAQLR